MTEVWRQGPCTTIFAFFTNFYSANSKIPYVLISFIHFLHTYSHNIRHWKGLLFFFSMRPVVKLRTATPFCDSTLKRGTLNHNCPTFQSYCEVSTKTSQFCLFLSAPLYTYITYIIWNIVYSSFRQGILWKKGVPCFSLTIIGKGAP